MKLRTGFVSNSSSSSFIIAFRKESDACPTCGHKDIPIAKIKAMFDNTDSDETKWRETGYDNVMRILCEWYEKGSDQLRERVDKVNTATEEGYEVAMVDVSYHDDGINAVLESQKDLKILDCTG